MGFCNDYWNSILNVPIMAAGSILLSEISFESMNSWLPDNLYLDLMDVHSQP